MLKQTEEKFRAFYNQYEAYVPAGFFALGFLFDVVTLSRIDDQFTMLQQAIYLLLIATYLRFEVINEAHPIQPSRFFSKLWTYRELIIHFIFGSLLSVFTLFYFKSSSLLVSGLFLLFLIVVMVANEFSRVQQSGVVLRIALLSLCLTSYFAYVIPTLLGFVGFIPFLLAILASILVLYGLERSVKMNADEKMPALKSRLRQAALAIQLMFVVLYAFQLIPPVPLSAQYMGVYHRVEREGAHFKLSYHRPWYLFWQNGAQSFEAAPGDRIYVYIRVFSPTRFRDQVYVRWSYRDPKQGWTDSDAIPMEVTGGRDQGFRGYTFKQNYIPGDWRVHLQTSDGREISRIGLSVTKNPVSSPREFRVDID